MQGLARLPVSVHSQCVELVGAIHVSPCDAVLY